MALPAFLVPASSAVSCVIVLRCTVWCGVNGTVSYGVIQMSSFRHDVKKLREATAQQGDIRQALREREETIRGEERIGKERAAGEPSPFSGYHESWRQL